MKIGIIEAIATSYVLVGVKDKKAIKHVRARIAESVIMRQRMRPQMLGVLVWQPRKPVGWELVAYCLGHGEDASML